MFHRTVRRLSAGAQGAFKLRRSKRIQLIGAFASGAVLSGALMASAMHGPAAAVAATRKAPRINLLANESPGTLYAEHLRVRYSRVNRCC